MQQINERLPQVCDENIEIIENYNKVAESNLEVIEGIVKNSGSPKLIASFEKVKEAWENGLKVSHKQTVELYEVSAQEARKILERL